MYNEEDYLMISGLQHFAFCRRQWALIHIEQQWAENYRTADGRLMHSRVHDGQLHEKRGDVVIARAMRVFSRKLGVSGECDAIEFHKSQKGVYIHKLGEKYDVIPVEYKRGKPKETDCDELQLCAQAICLEEMLCCEIPKAYLYYGETRHRHTVLLDNELREKTVSMINQMHELFQRQYTPRVKRTKSCNACSLKDVCLPVLCKKKSAAEYVLQTLSEDEGEE